ncbi:hypothetical protein PILCRDRAFT_16332 [Piloderma croceum F 1598]|uniref:Uncharacterized protein n=1 Tax=Piloderma croceum (strain F 1598) TaxID=765440 RepID=A0A0C3EW58_PILCF|nr:hypothetical protein PILCRDRAFT_16332 [Piloderma croceum F 1598]
MYGGGVLESYMQRVADAMSDQTWNEMKEKTLLQAALMEVANCGKCYMRRFADGGDLNTFHKAKINDAICTLAWIFIFELVRRIRYLSIALRRSM